MYNDKISAFIVEEYKYYGAYALQILADRANGFNMYVTSFIATAGILAFANYQKGNHLLEMPNLAYLFFLFGILHTFFFIRLGYLDKKYNYCVEKMNSIRTLYSERIHRHSTDLKNILVPRHMPRSFFGIHPLFPATMTFAHIATIFFVLGAVSLSMHWSVNTDVFYTKLWSNMLGYIISWPDWIIYVVIAVVITAISYFTHYKIGKADKTI